MNNKEKLKEFNNNNIPIVEITDKKLLDNIQGKKGEIAYTYEEDEFYIFNGEKWISYSDMPTPNFTMTSYELNKMIIKQLDYLTPEEKQEKYKLINEWHREKLAVYYAMIGKENNYYTIFKTGTIYELPNLGEGVLQCLENVGDIYSIEKTEAGDAIEIWVNYEDEPIVMYLFPYDDGVVVIGG